MKTARSLRMTRSSKTGASLYLDIYVFFTISSVTTFRQVPQNRGREHSFKEKQQTNIYICLRYSPDYTRSSLRKAANLSKQSPLIWTICDSVNNPKTARPEKPPKISIIAVDILSISVIQLWLVLTSSRIMLLRPIIKKSPREFPWKRALKSMSTEWV